MNKTSTYRGVSWFKNLNKWRAQITINYNKIHVGYFETETEAHAAYLSAKKKYAQKKSKNR
jgi:AP2-like factor (euAP2 lineage)